MDRERQSDVGARPLLAEDALCDGGEQHRCGKHDRGRLRRAFRRHEIAIELSAVTGFDLDVLALGLLDGLQRRQPRRGDHRGEGGHQRGCHRANEVDHPLAAVNCRGPVAVLLRIALDDLYAGPASRRARAAACRSALRLTAAQARPAAA